MFLETLWISTIVSKIFSNLPLFQHSSFMKLSFKQYSSSMNSSSYWVCQHSCGWARILHIKNVTWNSMVLSLISLLIKLKFLGLKYCVILDTQYSSSINKSLDWVLYSTILEFIELKSELVTLLHHTWVLWTWVRIGNLVILVNSTRFLWTRVPS